MAEVEQILKLVNIDKDPTEIFEILSPLGKERQINLGDGSYGSVYKSLHKESGQLVAIKIIPVLECDIKSIIQEMEILSQCDNPHVVKYFGAYYNKDHLWLVMEYCEAGKYFSLI